MSTGHSVQINLPRTVLKPEASFEWTPPTDKQGRPLSNAIERNRARTYFQAYAAGVALHFVEQALAEVRAGNSKTWKKFTVPDEAISCGFTEAVRGVLSHHMVIRDGKIANYHPYPPTPWNGSVRDSYGTPGPYEDAVQNTPIFEENGQDNFKGIDIMRAVRSFDPCLPCGVHMYVGNGKTIQQDALARHLERDLKAPVTCRRIRRSWPTAIDALLDDIAAPAGEPARAAAEELVRRLMQFYGAGLEQIMETLGAAGGAGPAAPGGGEPAGRRPARAARPAPGRARRRGCGTRWTRRGGASGATASGSS